MSEALESADVGTLRRLAVEAWQRAERLEVERVRAVQVKAEAVEEKEVVQAKCDALVTEHVVRIAELVRPIASAKSRHVQLELELHRLRTDLADSNDLAFGSTRERRSKNDDKAEKKPKKDKVCNKGHGPTRQPKLPIEPVVCALQDCARSGCGGGLALLAEPFEESERITSVRRSFVLKEVKRQTYACSGCGTLCAAPGPLRLVPSGRCDLALGVQVALDKHLDATPLERQDPQDGAGRQAREQA